MRWMPSMALLVCVVSAMAATNLETARQALMDGAWDSALLSADAAATNAADRTAARLIGNADEQQHCNGRKHRKSTKRHKSSKGMS